MAARQSTIIPLAPAIEVAETRWAVSELGRVIDRLGVDSVAGVVLRQAQQELLSLIRGLSEDKTVVGPLRLRRVA